MGVKRDANHRKQLFFFFFLATFLLSFFSFGGRGSISFGGSVSFSLAAKISKEYNQHDCVSSGGDVRKSPELRTHTHTQKKTVLDFTSVESSDLDCPVS